MRQFTVVAMDESKDWEPVILSACGGTIYTLYVFDPQERTHCCEFTPSFWLEPFEVEPISLPDDDEALEKLREELDEGRIQGTNSCYVHCHRIEALGDEFKLSEDFDDDTTLEDAAEYFSANGYVPPVLC